MIIKIAPIVDLITILIIVKPYVESLVHRIE